MLPGEEALGDSVELLAADAFCVALLCTLAALRVGEDPAGS